MKKTIILMLACMCVFMNASAQRNSGRLSLGVGLLYENGMDVTLAYEHEMNYLSLIHISEPTRPY